MHIVKVYTSNLFHIQLYVLIASQMWCLGRYLPLIIGDLVDEDDPNWNNYLSHLEIVDEIFAPVYCEDRIGYLKMIIEDFLYDFTSLYPNRPLTPKMHYLVHMPTWIKWYTHVHVHCTCTLNTCIVIE